MGRLIDADALFKELNDENIPWNRQINDIIMAQPTAYDVDAVVKKLDKRIVFLNGINNVFLNGINNKEVDCRLSEVIAIRDIVRKGGKE